MAHITKVNGTAYEISGGKTKINGTGYGIAGGKTRVNGTGYDISFAPPIASKFADNDWATIIWACQNNAVPSAWAVGDSKDMTINGQNYKINIIGKNHDTYSDGSGTAPLTFQMQGYYNTKYQMNSSNTNQGGWGSCAMRNTHLPAILALMPSEVQEAIKEVNKIYCVSWVTMEMSTVADKLFLLSEQEVWGKRTWAPQIEGSQYALYASGVSKMKNSVWWQRSIYVNNSTDFCCVYANGNIGYYGASASGGVVPAFCF